MLRSKHVKQVLKISHLPPALQRRNQWRLLKKQRLFMLGSKSSSCLAMDSSGGGNVWVRRSSDIQYFYTKISIIFLTKCGILFPLFPARFCWDTDFIEERNVLCLSLLKKEMYHGRNTMFFFNILLQTEKI